MGRDGGHRVLKSINQGHFIIIINSEKILVEKKLTFKSFKSEILLKLYDY